ncbi:unnamed protein product [Bemisia tabaci]|uniref:Uncharacterized protein n=1 Tax=Bemisia tabaci TaxID=7038 RepID=A0A9P0F108_BEMTA|nr:PREDICTED: uncharacterized protein LOC109030311 [Bemisia tabaci]CAH0385188.1 unnamed protein product [Bemisia tabaci]
MTRCRILVAMTTAGLFLQSEIHQNAGRCSVMSDSRKNFFTWIVSLIFCCWKPAQRNYSRHSNENCEKFNPSLEMGPLTLRDYVRTLEPYDPQRHGWRGNEPRPVSREIVIKNFDNSSETLLSSSPFKTALPPTHHINTSSTNNHIISSPLAEADSYGSDVRQRYRGLVCDKFDDDGIVKFEDLWLYLSR